MLGEDEVRSGAKVGSRGENATREVTSSGVGECTTREVTSSGATVGYDATSSGVGYDATQEVTSLGATFGHDATTREGTPSGRGEDKAAVSLGREGGKVRSAGRSGGGNSGVSIGPDSSVGSVLIETPVDVSLGSRSVGVLSARENLGMPLPLVSGGSGGLGMSTSMPADEELLEESSASGGSGRYLVSWSMGSRTGLEGGLAFVSGGSGSLIASISMDEISSDRLKDSEISEFVSASLQCTPGGSSSFPVAKID
jgi:hypothetical protein